MANYTLSYTGAQVNGAIGKALNLPGSTDAGSGKLLKATDSSGTLGFSALTESSVDAAVTKANKLPGATNAAAGKLLAASDNTGNLAFSDLIASDVSAAMTKANLLPTLGSSSSEKYLIAKYVDPSNQGFVLGTLPEVSTSQAGLLPRLPTTNGSTQYLNGLGSWATLPSMGTGQAGLVPAPTADDTSKFLRGDGTWQPVSGGGGGNIDNVLFYSLSSSDKPSSSTIYTNLTTNKVLTIFGDNTRLYFPTSVTSLTASYESLLTTNGKCARFTVSLNTYSTPEESNSGSFSVPFTATTSFSALQNTDTLSTIMEKLTGWYNRLDMLNPYYIVAGDPNIVQTWYDTYGYSFLNISPSPIKLGVLVCRTDIPMLYMCTTAPTSQTSQGIWEQLATT